MRRYAAPQPDGYTVQHLRLPRQYLAHHERGARNAGMVAPIGQGDEVACPGAVDVGLALGRTRRVSPTWGSGWVVLRV